MKKFTSTAHTTAETDRFVAALPLPHGAAIQGYLDELQRRRDADHTRGALVRQIRTTKLEEVVINAIRNCRAAFWVKQPRERASFLARKIALDLNRRGVAQDFDIRIIRRVVREVEKNPDILIQNAPAD